MGYRNWFCRIPRDFDIEKAAEDYEYRYQITERLYELGKQVEFDFKLNTIFDINEGVEDADGEWAVIEIEEMTKFIDWYARKHLSYLKLCITPIEEMSIEDKNYFTMFENEKPTAERFIKENIRKWSDAKNLIYNDDLKSDTIVKSWNYEHEIFEMLRIYKSFDRDNYYLVYYGG